jgi:dipeptidyl aminopeptidase/acylaminoacyl peptidase
MYRSAFAQAALVLGVFAIPSLIAAPTARAEGSALGGASSETPRLDPPPGARWSARDRLLAVESGDGRISLIHTVIGRVETRGERPRIAPGGERVVLFRKSAGGFQAVVVDVASGAELALPGTLAPGEDAAWSPDGRRLVIGLRMAAAAPDGAVEVPGEIFLLELDGEAPRLHRLTVGGGGGARWLGRGDRVLYEARDAHGKPTLFVRDRGGLGPAHGYWDDAALPADPNAVIIG